MQPGVSPVVAQDEETEPAPPPAPGPSQPSGPGPAFSPSGAGSGSGAGAPAPKPSEKPAAQPAGPSASSSSLPPLGAVTYENALKDESVFKAGYCFGRKAFSQYVGEGFKLRVMGPCHLLLDEAWITVQANGVMVGDGEVSIEYKGVDGAERSRIGLYVRSVNEELIGAHVQAHRGE